MKLLDEKGLTTVWAAIKNTFTSKSDADGKYAEKSKALGSINFNYTAWGLNMNTYNVDGDSYGYINITSATSKIAGVMTASDKAKLDGIASGANNYTLPTASASTLGGIKVNASLDDYNWPVIVDKNGFAYTKLIGLGGNDKGGIKWVQLEENDRHITVYSVDNILVDNNQLNFPSKSGTLALTSDIPTKTSQLTNDSTFLTSADKYTLPIASTGTLGGIRASSIYNTSSELWPIIVDGSAVAYTSIAGLHKSNTGSISNITIKDGHGSVAYGSTVMSVYDTQNDLKGVLNIPEKFGTLALLSDIPDVSNLCKFNFVSSISDCVNGRINFLFKNYNDYVDLNFLRNLEEGTILLIYSPFVEFQITDKGSVWYYNGRSVASEDTAYISKAKLVLAFFKDIYVYVCTFS